MNRPRFNRKPIGQRPDRDASAVRRTDKLLALVDSRLASHGATELADWLRTNMTTADMTTRACVLLQVQRCGFGRDVVQACRDAI